MGSISLHFDVVNPGQLEFELRSNAAGGPVLYDHDATQASPANYASSSVPSGTYAFEIRNQDGFQNVTTIGTGNHLTVDGKDINFQFVAHAEDEDHFDQLVLYLDVS